MFVKACVNVSTLARMSDEVHPELRQGLVILPRSVDCRELSNFCAHYLNRVSDWHLFEDGPSELDVLAVMKWSTIERSFGMGHVSGYIAR
jgi:hypothetical protein